jgi:hypothetical protein
MKHLLFLLVPLFFACNGSHNNHNAATEKPKTLVDSLYNEVIGYHDETMPKMGKLIGYQKALQAKIDSLEKISQSKKNTADKLLKSEYEQLQAKLKAAEKEMNDWMDSFEPDPKLPNQQKLELYWKDQQQKAKKMRDDILSSVDSAAKHI